MSALALTDADWAVIASTPQPERGLLIHRIGYGHPIQLPLVPVFPTTTERRANGDEA